MTTTAAMARPRRAQARSRDRPLPLRRAVFEIPIYDRPLPYVAGRAPPSAPIALVPPRDGDAYIVDKVVTPFAVQPADEQTVRRVLSYVVAWPDRPWAQRLVPCPQILDYVSPGALEAWEYARMLQAQTEKAEAEAWDAAHPRKRRHMVYDADADTEEEDLDDQIPEAYGVMPGRRRHGPARWRSGRPRRKERPKKIKTEHQAATETKADDDAPLSAPSPPRPSHLRVVGQGHQRTGLPLTKPVPLPLQQLAVESANESGGGADLDGLVWSRDQLNRRSASTTLRGGPDDPLATIPRPDSSRSAPPPTTVPKATYIPPPTIPSMSSRQPSTVSIGTPDNRDNHDHDHDESENDNDDADLYEVDRLESDFMAAPEDGSQPVRFFLVRWKGDWPPDQNPTWEPAENLPPRMIRNYLKMGAHRRAALQTARDGSG